ncbi:hypothetical protein BDV19DRAFT_353951 [Aspergillus venezuelensis]
MDMSFTEPEQGELLVRQIACFSLPRSTTAEEDCATDSGLSERAKIITVHSKRSLETNSWNAWQENSALTPRMDVNEAQEEINNETQDTPRTEKSEPTSKTYAEPMRPMFTQTGRISLDNQRTAPPVSVAPPFHQTTNSYSIVWGNQLLQPSIEAKIYKGFFLVNDKWTCYRRHYFSILCSFYLHPSASVHGPFFLKADNQVKRIHRFSMSVSAVANGRYNDITKLVQHTRRSDGQFEKRPPEKVTLQPFCQTETAASVPGIKSMRSRAQQGYSSDSNSPEQPQPPT